jgi:hypothetical protein
MFKILSRVWVTYKTGFGLDDWIYCTSYIHNSSLQVITVLSLIYTLYSSPLHTDYVSQSSLVVSWQRIHNSLTVTSNYTWSLLCTVQFLSCHYSATANSEDSTQFNSSAPKLIFWRLVSRNSTLHSVRYWSIEFFITPLHRPYGKLRLLLSPIVLGVFTAPLHSNGRGADHIENILSIVEECLPQARVYRVVA